MSRRRIRYPETRVIDQRSLQMDADTAAAVETDTGYPATLLVERGDPTGYATAQYVLSRETPRTSLSRTAVIGISGGTHDKSIPIEVVLGWAPPETVQAGAVVVVPPPHGRRSPATRASFQGWLKRQQKPTHVVVGHLWILRESAAGRI